jgi:hypothetical protein
MFAPLRNCRNIVESNKIWIAYRIIWDLNHFGIFVGVN